MSKLTPREILTAGAVVPVMAIDDLSTAVDLSYALVEGGIPLIPGVATPGEVQLALEHGIDTLKLFPAEVVGGKAMLKALYGPYADVRFCPTGGISLATAPEYLALPNVLCVGGSWLTPKEAIKNKDWNTITRLAREAAALKPKA